MSQEQGDLRVSVAFGGATVEFKGSPESVLHSVIEYISRVIPSIDLANKISVNYSLADLINAFGDRVKITPEGPRIWASDRKYSDKEVLLLQLVAAKIAHYTGKAPTDALTLAEIHASTGVNPKSISSRLSEVLKVGHVERLNLDSGVQYKITTAGINWLSSTISKRASR